MSVVHSNTLARRYLPTEFIARAEVRRQGAPGWAARLLWRSALRNILDGHLRRKSLYFDDACHIQPEAEDQRAGNEHEIESRRAPQLARDSSGGTESLTGLKVCNVIRCSS